MVSLVNTNNLCKTYFCENSPIIALNNINLEIKNGEFIAIIGQSGSGKSTLMNILGALDTQTSGNYFLAGESVPAMKENKLSKIRNQQIGFIFQGFNLIPTLNAFENVELPLIYRGIKKSTRNFLAKKALVQVNLSSRMYHKPYQLSGGQQQRVAIARAIAGDPSIILADEPTGNLDSSSGNEIIKILKHLNKDGKTIILITHDKLIANIAHRIIKLKDGSLVSDSRNALN
ncbi:MAG: ABC transporter ATP-binding protein [Eubacteriales bacterium SKADARSKE-1]|nr:ABC transporter ATP-binding protein [Eubacteriales bacterium SKADARSKE-1]